MAIAILLVAMLLASLARYEIVPTGAHKAYLLDRLTGDVHLIDNEYKTRVVPEK
ncbi:hypothetical protein KBW71_03450 [Hydrogenophaga aromaticivorans]|uniref:hypothetical protein n=1 Tax=Hydrogenophaga aromaticivorans TaxID=2610898 RepID=UPI001B386DB4|nr:hypothetical protein [Hydrogenophaga aromaticivorans]MBQ0917485.1 hypothetical protein [Hydrogenophaga aromaticivorans]